MLGNQSFGSTSGVELHHGLHCLVFWNLDLRVGGPKQYPKHAALLMASTRDNDHCGLWRFLSQVLGRREIELELGGRFILSQFLRCVEQCDRRRLTCEKWLVDFSRQKDMTKNFFVQTPIDWDHFSSVFFRCMVLFQVADPQMLPPEISRKHILIGNRRMGY